MAMTALKRIDQGNQVWASAGVTFLIGFRNNSDRLDQIRRSVCFFARISYPRIFLPRLPVIIRFEQQKKARASGDERTQQECRATRFHVRTLFAALYLSVHGAK